MRRPVSFALLALVAALVLAPAALASGSSDAHESFEGTLRTWHGDTAVAPVDAGAGLDTPFAGVLRLAGLDPAEAQKLAGRRVRALGRRSGTSIVVAADSSLSTAASPATTAAAAGVKTVAVILFNFSDNPSAQPWTAATVRNVVFDGPSSVNAYYQDSSYGQLSLSGGVFGYFTIPSANAGCDWRTWGTQARSAAISAGVPLSSYQYTLYAFPSAPGCGWSGLGYLPGTESWINNAMGLRVVAHELGHNFGTHHASSLACGTAVLATSGCSTSEYGDPYSVMGSSSQRLHTAYARAELGFLADTLTVSANGSYTLAPVDFAAGSLPRQLRIARGDGTNLFLEFRQPHPPFDAFSSTDPAVNGVLMRIGAGLNDYTQTKLLDAHPGGSLADAALGVGESWTDPVSRVTIAVVSVSPAGAGLTIQVAPDTTPPTTPGAFTARAASSSSIALSWSASTDNSGAVAGYRIWRDGTRVADVSGLSYTDTGLAAGSTYAYTLAAVDAAGNVSPAASASATTTAQDTIAPTAATGLTATVQKRRRVQLTWTAASDNVGVTGYRVLRNGAQIAVATTTAYRDMALTRGTYTYVVVALDAAGNIGPPSSSATVRI